MEEQNSGNAGSRTDGMMQAGAMTTQEIETRLKQMRDRGEIGMSQYNLARQDLLKYGVRFEDLPYLFVGKELPLDLTKESRRWYNARLPRDEAVKLLKNPDITAEKMRAIREYYSALPEEDVLLEALKGMDDAAFLKFMEDCKIRSNPVALSRRMDKIEEAVDTMGKTIEGVGANVEDVKDAVELLKNMFKKMQEREEAGFTEDPNIREKETEDGGSGTDNAGHAGERNISGDESASESEKLERIERNCNADNVREKDQEEERKARKVPEDSGDSGNGMTDSQGLHSGTVKELHREQGQETMQGMDDFIEVKNAEEYADQVDSSPYLGPPYLFEQDTGMGTGQERQAGGMRQRKVEDVKTATVGTASKMPSFFEKLLPGFYHLKKKDYIQLKQRERVKKDRLEEMKRMAEDLYAQNFMDEETYFIFCELAFKDQALDQETADVLIDGIKRGVPFALLFKVIRNVKNSADWEASVNLLESLMMYQKQNDERAQAALKG